NTPEAEVVTRLHDEMKPVLQDVVAALDAWMMARGTQLGNKRDWQHLLRIARQLDLSPSHRKLWALLSGRPAEVAVLVGAAQPWLALAELARARHRRLLEISSTAAPETDPVLAVVLLAGACRALGDNAGAEDILRRAVTTRPDKVVLLDFLGKLL